MAKILVLLATALTVTAQSWAIPFRIRVTQTIDTTLISDLLSADFSENSQHLTFTSEASTSGARVYGLDLLNQKITYSLKPLSWSCNAYCWNYSYRSAISNDGAYLVRTEDQSERLEILKKPQLKEIILPFRGERFDEIKINTNSKLIATHTGENIQIFDLATGTFKFEIPLMDKIYSVFDFTEDGQFLVIFDPKFQKNVLAYYDLTNQSYVRKTEFPRNVSSRLMRLKLSPDGKYAVISRDEWDIVSIDLSSGKILWQIDVSGKQEISISKDQKYLVTKGYGIVRIYDFNTGKELQEISGDPVFPQQVVIADDSKHLISVNNVEDPTTSTWSSTLTVYSIEREKVILNHRLNNHRLNREVDFFLLSPNGQFLFTHKKGAKASILRIY